MAYETLQVEITALVDRDATVAEVTLLDTCTHIPTVLATVTGSSKRENGDVYDPAIGVSLAVGRALVDLGFELIDVADAGVKQAAAEAEERAAKAAERKQRREMAEKSSK